jgi:hypothetical protein
VWTIDSRWFDVAAFSTLWAGLVIVFGHFEQHKPAWRRLLKFALLLMVLIGLVEIAGRVWAYATLALLLGAGGTIHFTVLSRHGINGWSGEPREKFEALLREIADHGEIRTLYSLGRRPRS